MIRKVAHLAAVKFTKDFSVATMEERYRVDLQFNHDVFHLALKSEMTDTDVIAALRGMADLIEGRKHD